MITCVNQNWGYPENPLPDTSNANEAARGSAARLKQRAGAPSKRRTGSTEAEVTSLGASHSQRRLAGKRHRNSHRAVGHPKLGPLAGRSARRSSR